MSAVFTYCLRFQPILICLVMLITTENYAQEIANKQIDEVQVTGFSPERFMAGLKVQKIDSATLSRFQFQTLADFLQYQSPITFKSYGTGQLTSIAFRGTSAMHTAVLWNGLNINNPMAGQTDFSTVPLLGFDQMSIQYGSSASCVGSDAVGGSILLGSVPQWKKQGTNFTLGGQYGSFDNYNLQTGLRFVKTLKNGLQFSGKTLLYGSQYNNHFSATERTDSKGRTYPIEPSETSQKGFIQDLYLKQKNNNLLSLNIWLTDNKLSIQPDVIAFREITQTKAYRFLTSYQFGNTNLKAAFVRDIIDYGTGDFANPSHSETDRYITRAEHEFSFKKADSFSHTSIRIGGEFVHYVAKVDGYNGEAITENRQDIFALIRQQIAEKLTASLNLRQAFSTKYKAPFTPSLGIEYAILSTKKHELKATANIARSYRLPTLNERYWKVLGNPDIRPENGVNKEIGVNWKQVLSEKVNTSLGINVYHNLINDWTYWNPDKAYRVENLQQVLAKGIEVSGNVKYANADKIAGLTVNYALTNTSQQKVYAAYTEDFIGKQMIYVPRHSVSGTAFVGKGNWTFNIQGLYNSERFITFDHSGRPFPAYFILNSTISGKILLGKIQSNLIFQTNNLTDTVYPSVKKNAMPGRSFSLGWIVSI
ncbi:TonB-dependent receptor plug domain-containing protein [Arcicella rigui]|uniref:TonB-dependent receptor plug domain-containing protein n=1 Tax=Arcicella rigui TaxID=797020 RepID=A0ABU5Q565_9BACT|nr:TonB-dependent receptor plug domain-containing protein [Arcicella rigui]MEA5137792.1 TonB-dependent receptor plug domain-containing protein [Arcicella rigui]